MDGMLKILQEIKKNMYNTNIPIIHEIKSEEVDFESTLPIQNLQDFIGLEDFLLEDKNRDAVISFLKRVGGKSVEETVKRMLVRLVTNEVATNFSWEGRKGKRVLRDLQIMKIMKNVVRSGEHKALYNDKVFENKVKDWFRSAKGRMDSKKKDT